MATAEYERIENADYHADTSHVGHSMLKDFLVSRRTYHARNIAKSLPEKRTTALDIGTVAHAAILEPHIIDDVCLEIPSDVLSKSGAKSGKAWKDFQTENAERILLHAREIKQVRDMQAAVYANPACRKLLECDGPVEASIRWECERTGLKRKMRADKMPLGLGRPWVVDIKTCIDVSPAGFAKAMANFGYYTQAPYYSHGIEEKVGETPAFVFVAVGKEPPHPCRLYALSADAYELGEERVWSGLESLAACYESDEWGEPDETRIVDLDLPAWAYTNNQWETTT